MSFSRSTQNTHVGRWVDNMTQGKTEQTFNSGQITMDMLTCGACLREYPLSNITEFIQHKSLDCHPVQGLNDRLLHKELLCTYCSMNFRTAWGLLQHVQSAHSVKICVQRDIPRRVPMLEDNVQCCLEYRDHYQREEDFLNKERMSQRKICHRQTSPNNYPRNTLGEWLDCCSNSPTVHSPTSGYSALTPTGTPESERHRTSPVQPDPLPLDLKLTMRRSLSSDSDNSLNGFAHSNDKEFSHCRPSPCILPKKRKWSQPDSTEVVHLIPPPKQNNTTSFEKISKQFDGTGGISKSINFIPKWKYSMGLQSSLMERCSDSNSGSGQTHNLTSPQMASSSAVCITLDDDHEQSKVQPFSPRHSESDEPKEGFPNGPLDFSASSTDEGDSPATPDHTQIPACIPISASSSTERTTESPNDDLRVIADSTAPHGPGKKRRYPTTRPFKCEHCDHSFNQRIHLKKHLSKHTGIKPYKCGICEYSTVERSHLKVHVRIHTGEKPYKCTFCDYATAQNSTLKIHLKRHHGGQMFKCETCFKTFTQLTALTGHVKIHAGDLSYHQEPDDLYSQENQTPSNAVTSLERNCNAIAAS